MTEASFRGHRHYPECDAANDAQAKCNCNDIEDAQIAKADAERRERMRAAISPADLIRQAKGQGLIQSGQQYH